MLSSYYKISYRWFVSVMIAISMIAIKLILYRELLLDLDLFFDTVAVAASALLFDWFGGLVTATICIVGHLFFFVEPRYSFALTMNDASALLTYFVSVVLVIWLIQSSKKAHQIAYAANNSLQFQTAKSNELRLILENAVDAVGDPMMILEPVIENDAIVDFTIRYINEQGASFHTAISLARRHQIGRKISLIAPDFQGNHIIEKLLDVYHTGRPLMTEVAYRSPGYPTRHLQFQMKRIQSLVVMRWQDLSKAIALFPHFESAVAPAIDSSMLQIDPKDLYRDGPSKN